MKRFLPFIIVALAVPASRVSRRGRRPRKEPAQVCKNELATLGALQVALRPRRLGRQRDGQVHIEARARRRGQPRERGEGL